MKVLKSFLTNRYSSMWFKSITKVGSVSYNSKVTRCGFEIGRSKLY